MEKYSRTRTAIASKAETEDDIGFRFDESMQRWVRDDRFKGKSMTLVRPKSGMPYTVWPVMHTYLVQKGLQSINQQRAIDLVNSGKATLVDVRLADDFKDQHAEGAVNVPMYRITAGNGGWDKFKRFAMASLFMKATERDPEFLANFEKVVPKNKKVVIMCAVGGTLETIVKVETTGKQCKDPERNFGRETRSLKACYELMKAGWKDVMHLEGGLSSWRYEGYPLESSN